MNTYKVISIAIIGLALAVAPIASANHSWGGYHWARTSDPFTVKLGNDLSSAWSARLAAASSDWSLSDVLDTTVVPGVSSPRNCRATNGRVEVCDYRYGNNGWLGLASIWISGSHITQGTVKLNDTYFNTPTYNTTAWRQFVVCQEVGHTFGLAHQDEDFYNLNLGTCMDYTNNPARNDGVGDNLHPNQHDYGELDLIYSHLDGFTTLLSKTFGSGALANNKDIDTSDPAERGKEIKKSHDGKSSLFERDLGKGEKIFTFVLWAQ